MADGRVRAILWKHLHARAGPLPSTDGIDPATMDANALVPAEAFTRALEAVAERDGIHALARAGRDYARLWARTFSTLVRHTTGRPQAMLDLLVREVLPYLRGHALAGRIESSHPPTLRLEDDLPAPYVQGLLEGFLALADCDGAAKDEGGGLWTLRIHVRPAARLQHMVHLARTLRLPYVATAVAGTLVGLFVAPYVSWFRAAVILVGVLSAQAAANALPDLLEPQRPLHPSKPRLWLSLQLGGSTLVALAAGAWLARDSPTVIGFAAAGALVAAAYPVIRRWGLGPLVTAFAHGPALTAAVALAADPTASVTVALRAGVPVGFAAAALLVLGDMADRPLDQAAGDRTMSVRIPGRAQVLAYAVPLSSALAAAVIVLWPAQVLSIISLAALATAAGFLVHHVAHNLSDPGGLAPARLATLLLHVGITGTLIGGFL